MMLITIPYPPSVNSYWRTVNGRTLLSKRGREYKVTVAKAVLIHAANRHLVGRLEVELVAHPPDNRRRDIDNLAKGILDSLQNAGVYLDDSQIDKLTIIRAGTVPGGVVIVKINERMSEGETGNTLLRKDAAPKRRADSDKGKSDLAGNERPDARPARRGKKADQAREEGGEEKAHRHTSGPNLKPQTTRGEQQ